MSEETTEQEAPKEKFDWAEWRKTDEEIKQLALGYMNGTVFSSCFHGPAATFDPDNPPEVPPDPFMDFTILKLVLSDPKALESFRQDVLPELGDVYEYMSGQSGIAVNGRPTFMSHKFLHKEDMKKLLEVIEKIGEVTV